MSKHANVTAAGTTSIAPGGIAASGLVLPPGAARPPAKFAAGPVEVKVESVTPENAGIAEDKFPVPAEGEPAHVEYLIARLAYPDGSTKDHQVLAVEDLLPKVVGTLRGKLGVTEVRFTAVPAELAAGAVIGAEVS